MSQEDFSDSKNLEIQKVKDEYQFVKSRRAYLKREYLNISKTIETDTTPEKSCKIINDYFKVKDPINLPSKWNSDLNKKCFGCG